MRDSASMDIRAAHPTDALRLTAIAHAAKRHWGYSEDLISLWQADLTVSPQFIADFPVFCAVRDSEIVGFYALSRQGEFFELEHLWVDPQHREPALALCSSNTPFTPPGRWVDRS